MRKVMFTLTMLLGAVALVSVCYGPAIAAVAGQCVNCHTMHYSQGDTQPDQWGDSGPYDTLLTDDCIGCHTGTDDPLDDTYHTPYVISSTSAFNDDKCLAGGFFPIPDNMGSESNDDDHHGIGNKSPPAGSIVNPPDWYTGTIDGLGCAGTNGCHGNEIDLSDMDGIKGGHHNTGLTYRMLYVDGDPVEGYGTDDYEEAIIQTPSTAPVVSGDTQNVNIYCAGTATGNRVTISEFCGKCHGDFHGLANTDSEGDGSGQWIRHPTENQVPLTWALGNSAYTPDGDDYKNNPPGYDNATYDITAKRVTCLSCHRAHGTANDDLLRWAYSTQQAGTTNDYGCLGCHNEQTGTAAPAP